MLRALGNELIAYSQSPTPLASSMQYAAAIRHLMCAGASTEIARGSVTQRKKHPFVTQVEI